MFKIKLSKTIKDIQWSFIALAVSSFVHLLLRIVLGRELGPSGLGLYTLVFTIYLFGMQFAAFGIGVALTKYIAEYNDDLQKIKEFVSSGIAGSLVSGFILGILLYSFSLIISVNFFHNPEMTTLLKITAFCFPFIAMQKVVLGTLNGLRRMKYFAFINIVQNLSVMGMSIALVIFLNMGVKGAVFGFVIPTIIVGLFSLILVKNYFVTASKVLSTSLKEISLFGFYVVLANSIGMVNTQIDSLLIGHFMNETEVGYYAVAIIFMQGIILLPQSVQKVTNPSIATYYGKGDYDGIRRLIKNSMAKIFVIILFISAFLATFGKSLINVIFTEEFIPSYAPLLILLIGYSVYATFISIGGCLSSIGKVKIIFKISLLCAVLNTLLNISLIPEFGLVGAASATSISLLFTTLINIYFVNKYVRRE
ncbi:MAG: flippase [Candidatus Thorarchaeota archaeon]